MKAKMRCRRAKFCGKSHDKGAIWAGTGSVLVGPLGDPTKGGTEHVEVYIPAIIKNQMVHFNIIGPSRNDSWCPFSRPMWCSGHKTLAL